MEDPEILFDQDNAPRCQRPGVAAGDHVESWFLRANHPTRPRALWLKATVLCARRGARADAHVWGAVFDQTGETPRALAWRGRLPLGRAAFSSGPPWRLGFGPARFRFGAAGGESRGVLPPSSPRTPGELAWDLSWVPPGNAAGGGLSAPLQLFPGRAWIERGWPRNKLVTPAPLLRFGGSLRFADEEWALDDWIGMQGHNWGPAHAPEYVWMQCVFWDAENQPFALMEAACGRIRLPLGRRSPIFSLLTLRLPEREYRFDRLQDFYRHRVNSLFPAFDLHLRGAPGALTLQARARPELMVDLPYQNPNGQVSRCLNSKLAKLSLRLDPENGDTLLFRSPHAAALEFLYAPAALPSAARAGAAITTVASEPAPLLPATPGAVTTDRRI